jgi:pyruvate/2-oxoglutarate dehydrogenase complex dihydrolipoamide dehydrogenase (E3) component
MMSGRLEGNTVKKLRCRQRVLLYLAAPVLQRVEKPSTLRWLTGLWMPLGKKVAIVGGDFVACELAEFLASRGRNVVILGSGTQMATEMPIPSRWRLLNSLLERRVIMLTEAKCQEITADGLAITTKKAKDRHGGFHRGY